jgi:hypothetical protein
LRAEPPKSLGAREFVMTKTWKSVALFCGLLGIVCASVPNQLRAQAPPGPLPPRQSPDTESAPPPLPSTPAPPRAPKEKPAPRQNISGYWNLNRDASDNARANIDQARTQSRRTPSTYPGNGNGGPYGGGPIGGGPIGGGGYPFPGGGNGPYGGGRRNPNGGYPGDNGTITDSEEQAPAMQEYIYPSTGVTFVIKDAEVDLSDDSARRRVFYTDGRKLAKPDKNDNNYREIAAHWEGNRLVSEEKSPAGEQVHRTFELSLDGTQLDENITLDATRSRSAVMIRYVYDINTNRQ